MPGKLFSIMDKVEQGFLPDLIASPPGSDQAIGIIRFAGSGFPYARFTNKHAGIIA